MTNDFEDEDLNSLLPIEPLTEEQQEFNKLSKDSKFDRLNSLIKRSQIYSQIIADNILESSLNKRKREEDVENHEEVVKKVKTRKGKGKVAKKGKVQHDITKMLSQKVSDSTTSTKQAIETAQSQSTHTQKQPKLVTGCVMKDYQLDGLEWLITLYENGLNGILADEMGLGKTLQCIAFLCFLIENKIEGPFLVVAPLSTLSNWYNEITKFAPALKVLMYRGSKNERLKLKIANNYNIVLTSYEICIRDYNKLNSTSWKYLIVDEGHRLKNSGCLLIRFLKKLDIANRLLITGTPLQNNLDELWSLLNFILPDIFHDLELFQQWFNFDEIMNIINEDDEENQETKKAFKMNIQENLIKNLHTILKPFLLRRLKKDVVTDLPPKKEYLIHIPLSDLQQKIYNDAINSNLHHSLIEMYLKEYLCYNHGDMFRFPQDNSTIEKFLVSKSKTILNNRKKEENYREPSSDDDFESNEDNAEVITNRKNKMRLSNEDKKKILLENCYNKFNKEIRNLSLQNLVIQLRNICNSPYIYYEPFPRKEESFKENLEFMDLLYQNSAKLQVLDQICSKLLSNHKLLVFSQFTKMLDLLHDWFLYKGIDVCRLDGSTNHNDRDVEINDFKEDHDKRIFLLSTRAGGLGINLTAADTVVLFDNDWNPQIDLQAIDRVHRIGQTEPVKVFRFLVKNSIEELLISKSSSKRFLERLVIQMGQFKFNKLQKLIDEKDYSIRDFIEMSKCFKTVEDQKETSSEREFTFTGKVKRHQIKLLDDSEMNELLDRSKDCYNTDDDSSFTNISVFESINNLDK